MILQEDLRITTLPKGTVLRIYGYPVVLIKDVKVHCPIVDEIGIDALHKKGETILFGDKAYVEIEESL